MGRRDENKEDKRRRLEAAAVEAFLEHGFAGASIEQIVAGADVARGTFYLYFPEKEAIFAALVDRLLTPLVEAVKEARDALARCEDTPSTFPIYAALGLQVTEILGSQTELVRLYLAEARGAGQSGVIVRERSVPLELLVREILDDAVRRGLLRSHDTAIATHAILGAIERVAMQILGGDRNVELGRAPAEIIVLFRQGLAP